MRKNWTCSLIKQCAKNNFNVEYSDRGMIKVFHRLELSFTRPTHTLEKANIQKQEGFKGEFELLKNLIYGKIDHILF